MTPNTAIATFTPELLSTQDSRRALAGVAVEQAPGSAQGDTMRIDAVVARERTANVRDALAAVAFTALSIGTVFGMALL